MDPVVDDPTKLMMSLNDDDDAPAADGAPEEEEEEEEMELSSSQEEAQQIDAVLGTATGPPRPILTTGSTVEDEDLLQLCWDDPELPESLHFGIELEAQINQHTSGGIREHYLAPGVACFIVFPDDHHGDDEGEAE